MVEDCNCRELKHIISRCRFFIGARTHVTIAAYSSCVPTLVLGYSVKSRGIARDLFGTEVGYVLPVQKLTDSYELVTVESGEGDLVKIIL
jgi:polysaccharide pyruvyl transferase WcaK-like protein